MPSHNSKKKKKKLTPEEEERRRKIYAEYQEEYDKDLQKYREAKKIKNKIKTGVKNFVTGTYNLLRNDVGPAIKSGTIKAYNKVTDTLGPPVKKVLNKPFFNTMKNKLVTAGNWISNLDVITPITSAVIPPQTKEWLLTRPGIAEAVEAHAEVTELKRKELEIDNRLAKECQEINKKYANDKKKADEEKLQAAKNAYLDKMMLHYPNMNPSSLIPQVPSTYNLMGSVSGKNSEAEAAKVAEEVAQLSMFKRLILNLENAEMFEKLLKDQTDKQKQLSEIDLPDTILSMGEDRDETDSKTIRNQAIVGNEAAHANINKAIIDSIVKEINKNEKRDIARNNNVDIETVIRNMTDYVFEDNDYETFVKKYKSDRQKKAIVKAIHEAYQVYKPLYAKDPKELKRRMKNYLKHLNLLIETNKYKTSDQFKSMFDYTPKHNIDRINMIVSKYIKDYHYPTEINNEMIRYLTNIWIETYNSTFNKLWDPRGNRYTDTEMENKAFAAANKKIKEIAPGLAFNPKFKNWKK